MILAWASPFKVPLYNYADRFFVTTNMLKEIFDHIPLFSLCKKNLVLEQN